MKIIQHQGWGRTSKSKSKCFSILEFNLKTLESTSSGLPIGLGRSYGDSSINTGGVYLSLEDTKDIKIDTLHKTATCEAGATIGDLERAAIEFGLFPPTVPGTEFVTIGGAVASNIHGKSHHIAGSFASAIVELKLFTSIGEILALSPVGPSADYFWATVGGMGLTGVIIEVTISLKDVQTGYIHAQELRAQNLNKLLHLIKEFDKKYLYTVAWIDLSGSFSGRGRVLGGNHASLDQLPRKLKSNPLEIDTHRDFSMPDIFPSNFINQKTITYFNKFWFNKPLNNGFFNIQHFFHPLDSIKNWNRIYGKKGFFQYQFQISFENEFIIEEILKSLKDKKISSPIAVLKKFGNSDNSFLGFPAPGWTLAVDIPSGDQTSVDFFDKLTDRLCELSGRIYLTKDAILHREQFEAMYPKSVYWKKIKAKLDPVNYWQSDQGKRIGLC
jgi:decaprenylphospho-beta-D-ribofuranose 2-oxidase